MTNRQRVLKKWSRAVLDRDGWIDGFGFFDCAIFANQDSKVVRGHGETPAQAWADAARRVGGSSA